MKTLFQTDRTRAYSDQEFTRSMNLDAPSSINEEARTAELSLSSDSEIEMWPGEFEQLSHEPGAIDLSRMQGGGVLLWNHDRNQPIGRLDNVRVDPDKKLRATATFGTSAKANEVFNDVKAGILRRTSIGYRVLAYTTEKRDDNTTIYHATKWRPSEGSIVAVPADISTGVDRAENQQHPNTNADMNPRYAKRYQSNRFLEADKGDNATTGAVAPAATTGVSIEQERAAGAVSERQRMSAILESCRTYGCPEIAEKAIADGMTLDQVRALLLEKAHARNENLKAAGKPVGLGKDEVGKFRFMNLFRAMADPTNPRAQEAARFEIEACQAAGDQVKHRSLKGIMIPTDVLLAPIGGERERAAISVASGAGYTGDGANVIATTLLASAFIEILRNRCVLMNLGTQLGGLVGNFEIPKMTSTQFGGGWIGEDAVAPNTQVDFGQIPMTPKTAAAYAYITRKMLTQPSIGVEALVRMDIAKKLATVIDLAGFYGTGTNSDPVGLKNVTGINAVQFATANAPLFTELVNMETRIALDNADVPSMAYVANAAFRGYAKTTLRFPLGQNGSTITQLPTGGTIWEPGDTVNGYRTEISNQVATGDVFFGNWADMLIGLWGGLEIIADPYTKSTQGGITISAFQDVDVEIRRVQSFCYGNASATANQA